MIQEFFVIVRCQSHNRLGETSFHLLADTAYPFSVYIMVPFKRNWFLKLEEHENAFKV